jgi:pyrimidine 5'-nucleotidase
MNFSTLFFDLDDTLYPPESGLWGAIGRRIELFMHDIVQIPWEEIPAMRKQLFFQYGTTMRGLQTIYHIDTADYLAFVHDVPLREFISPDAELRKVLLSLPQRKVIFTNADANHANRVLRVLELEGIFEKIIDICATAPYCKPEPQAFEIALKLAGEASSNRCVLIDDAIHNLAAARESGFYTVYSGSAKSEGNFHIAIPNLYSLPDALKKIDC